MNDKTQRGVAPVCSSERERGWMCGLSSLVYLCWMVRLGSGSADMAVVCVCPSSSER